MPEPKIKRKFRAFSVPLTTSTLTAVSIRFDDVAGGAIELGTSATTFATISIWGSESPTSTFGKVYKADGSVCSVSLAQSQTESRVYALPDECYGLGAVRLIADQPSGTAASCVVMLKG